MAWVSNLTRITGAILMREIHTRFGRDNVGFAWIILEPAILCCGVIAAWSVIKSDNFIDLPVIPFLITGYMPLILYRHCVMVTMRCMQANSALLYHRNVSILSMYIARMIVEVLGTMAAFLIVGMMFFFLGFVEVPYSWSTMLVGWGIYCWVVVSIAIYIGALSERTQLVEKFWPPISYVTLPLTGTFYMVYWLPPEARELLAYVPFITGVELLRGGYVGPEVPIYYNIPVAIYFCLCMTVAGLWLLKDARKFIEIE